MKFLHHVCMGTSPVLGKTMMTKKYALRNGSGSKTCALTLETISAFVLSTAFGR